MASLSGLRGCHSLGGADARSHASNAPRPFLPAPKRCVLGGVVSASPDSRQGDGRSAAPSTSGRQQQPSPSDLKTSELTYEEVSDMANCAMGEGPRAIGDP